MSVDTKMLAALDLIYAAALDENRWLDAIRSVLEITDCQAGSFCVLDGSDQPKLPFFRYLNIEKRAVDQDRFMQEYLQEGMAERDPTVQYIVAHPTQQLVLDSAFLTESDKDKHSYYNWHQGFSDTRHRMAGMVKAAPQVQSGLTVHRTRQKGVFDEADVRRFEFLIPHIERAVSIAFRLGTLGAVNRACLEMLDNNPHGIILLDGKGKVLFANRAALAIDSAQDGMRILDGNLIALRGRDSLKLQQLIAAALAVYNKSLSASPGVMRVNRASGKSAYALLVSPLPAANTLMTTATPAVCVLVSDPEQKRLLPEDALKKLFGLTPSEARLAVRLARGDALNVAASELGIGYNTARTQLAMVFKKTGTTRQGELIKLLLADVPSLFT